MAITICTVSGNVKNLLGDGVENCLLRVSATTPFFHTGSFISGEVSSVQTSSTGNFSLGVIETETVGQKLTFTFEYFDGVANRRLKKYSVVVPDSASADLSDLVTIDASPVTTATFPASAVTITPAISNLDADNVQDALEEIQVDIDTRATTSALTAHTGASTGVHGATGAVVGTTDSQTLTNKTLAVGSNHITGTTSRVPRFNASTGDLEASSVTNTELGYVSGVTSAIQTQLDAKMTNALTSAHLFVGNGSNVATDVAVTGDVTISNSGVTAVGANKVTDAMLRQSAGLSVIARSANSTGNVADVTAGTDGNILRRNGTSIGFGSINLASSGAVGSSIAGVANGGTGVATLAAHGVVVGNGASAVNVTGAGTAGQVLTSNGASADPTFQAAASQTLAVSTKTANYTALTTDDLILCNTNAFTVTLPAATNTGKVLRIKKIGSDANAITIARAGSDTIDGATSKTLSTQYESLTLVADGSATWSVLTREYPQGWTAYTPTTAGLGTLADVNYRYRRVGDSIDVIGSFTVGTASGTVSISIPSGLAIDTTKVSKIPGGGAYLGLIMNEASSGVAQNYWTLGYTGYVFYDGSDTSNIYLSIQTQSGIFQKSTWGAIGSNGEGGSIRFTVPISGWEG